VIRLGVISLAALVVGGAPTSAPARLGVTAKEFHFLLSRTTVKAGHVVIELRNAGQDVHDLHLQRIGGTNVYSLPATSAGLRSTLETRLRAGRYRLWCSIADHRARGMSGILRVRP
jgi:plastocyanin